MDHEHQFIEMEFASKEEFQTYFEDSDLANQFAVTHSQNNRSFYKCIQSKNLHKRERKLPKKVDVEKFDCNANTVAALVNKGCFNEKSINN